MVDKENFYMELVEPRTSWIPKFLYEVFRTDWVAYVDIFLNKPKDPIVERFETYDEITNKKIKKKVEEKVEKSVGKMMSKLEGF